MPAAVAGRGWMGSPAAGLGPGDPGAQSSAGGQILCGSYRSPLAVPPRKQQPFSPLAKAAVQTVSKLLPNTAVMGTNRKLY